MNESPQSESLHVLLLAEDFHPRKSGGAFIDWNVAKHLAECGDEVTVVTPRTGSLPSEETVDDVEIRRPFAGTPEDTPANSLRGQIRRIIYAVLVFPYLIRLSWGRDFDLVYSTNHLCHPIAAVLRTIFHYPLVTFVGYSPSIYDDVSLTDPLVLVERLNFRFCMGERTLCQAPSVYDELNRLSDAVVRRVDGTVDMDDVYQSVRTEVDGLPADVGERDATIQLVFVGRLSELKSPTAIIELLANLSSHYTLVIVGDGPRQAAVEDAIYEADLDDRVRLTGRLPHEQALRVIYESELLVLSSEADAYPAVVFEALALNTPVLATPVGVLPTIDHQNLTTAPLEEFSRVIPELDLDGGDGIDEETLAEYSVDRLAREVREHMLAVTSG